MANVQTLTLPKSDDSDLQAEIARLRAENAALKDQGKKLSFKLTGDGPDTYTGTVQLVNLRKLAPSFHPTEWDAIFSMADAWKACRDANAVQFTDFVVNRKTYTARREKRNAEYEAKKKAA